MQAAWTNKWKSTFGEVPSNLRGARATQSFTFQKSLKGFKDVGSRNKRPKVTCTGVKCFLKGRWCVQEAILEKKFINNSLDF